MKRVLLTGGTGFIGRHCLPLLVAKGYEVHAVSSKALSNHCTPNVYWHQANLMNSGQVSRLIAKVQPTHMLHFAWYTEPGKYLTSLENIRWIQASLVLLQEFYSHGGKRVVMSGTCAEYSWEYGYCSERITPLAPATLYGTCKHSLQSILNSFSRESGLSSAWGRIFFLYGPYEHPHRLVASVIRALLQDQTARCSHGTQIRDFLFVEDVASAFVALLESDFQGPLNIGSGQPIALKTIVAQIGNYLGHAELIEFGTIPVSRNDAPLLVANVHRLINEVGWSPKYSLEEGLQATIAWWRQNAEKSEENQ